MIFRRAIVAELASSASAVFTVLFSIVFSVGLVRILGDAAGGRIDNEAVFSLVALSALTWLPPLLTLTLFVAVLFALTRAFRDSEMVVWFAAGRSLLHWIGPVLRFAAPVVLLVALLSLVVTPWAQRQIVESKERFEQRDDVARVAPGRFIESAGAQRVFFVEHVDLEAGKVRNVFVSHRSQGREAVIVAAEGVIEVRPDGERFVVLSQGRRYEGTPGQAEYRLVEFERYAIRIEARAAEPLQQVKARAKTTRDLIVQNAPFDQAELVWRIGFPLMTLLLALLAVPLAWTNPRLGRSTNLLVAVFVFFCYLSGMQLIQAHVQLQRLDFGIALWLPHAIVSAAIVLMFVRRVHLQRWLPRWPWPAAARAGR